MALITTIANFAIPQMSDSALVNKDIIQEVINQEIPQASQQNIDTIINSLIEKQKDAIRWLTLILVAYFIGVISISILARKYYLSNPYPRSLNLDEPPKIPPHQAL
jgi:hypothetical protein